MNKIIFIIAGKARVGKDTFAKILEQKIIESFQVDKDSILITHYADLLKYICSNYLGWNGEKDENGRTLLQNVGTNIIREIDPNYWVSFIKDVLKFFPDKWQYVIIPDGRFPNEINLDVDGYQTVKIFIKRKGDFISTENASHQSENIPNVDYNFYLNNTTIEEMNKYATILINTLKGGMN